MAAANLSEECGERPVYWVARGVPVVDDAGRNCSHFPVQKDATYDPDEAKRWCLEWRKVYPDAIVIEERPFA